MNQFNLGCESQMQNQSLLGTINRKHYGLISNISFISEKCKQHQQQIHQFQQQHKYSSSKLLSSASTAANNGTKSFMSRLRQFTGRFSFSFDREPKRSNATTHSNTSRNNNSNESTTITKGSFCCSNRMSASPQHNPKNDIIDGTPPTTIQSNILSAAAVAASTQSVTTRNRAYSLDVPVRTRYSSSASGGGDSRKSSRNDDNHHMTGPEDNNSNHTTIGDNKSVTEGNENVMTGNSI